MSRDGMIILGSGRIAHVIRAYQEAHTAMRHVGLLILEDYENVVSDYKSLGDGLYKIQLYPLNEVVVKYELIYRPYSYLRIHFNRPGSVSNRVVSDEHLARDDILKK